MAQNTSLASLPIGECLNLVSIQIDIFPDTVEVVVGGELDMCTGDRLLESVEPFVSHSPERILLDLGGVTFMDSAGAHALTRLADMAGQGDLVIETTRCSPTVERILATLGIPAPGSRLTE